MTTATVHRFHLSTGRWSGAFPTGGAWPKVVAADPQRDAIWVSNWDGRSVTRLDRVSGEVDVTVPVGGEPRGMVFTDGGAYLWVCIFSSGEVVVIDTASNAIVDRIGPTRGAARHIVASPVDGTLALSDMYHGAIRIIDSRRREIIQSRRIGININTIAFDPHGRYLFVSERGRNNRDSYLLPGPEFGRIFVLDPRDLSTIQVVYGRHQPTGLAVSPDGRYLATTDFLDDNLSVYRVGR